MQHALPRLLAASEGTRDAIRARIAGNHRALAGRARNCPVTVLAAEGGWSSVVRLPGFRTEEEWTLGLLDDCGVLVQPGWFYDFETGPFVVLSLLTPPAAFEEGTQALFEYVTRAG